VLIELSRNYLYVTDIPEEDAPSIVLLLDTFGFKFNQNLNGWAIGANETPNIIDDVLLSFEESNVECIIAENLQHFINNQLQARDKFLAARDQARKYKNGELDEIIPPVFNEHLASFIRPLRHHQIKAAKHLYLLKNGANFSVPGAGKTSVVLSVYEMLKKEGNVNCLFVVGPTACFYPWRDEFKKQLARAPENVILAGMIKQERVNYYYLPVNRRPELYLISYQTLTNDLNDIIQFFKNKDNNIYFVVDEAHYIKQLGGAWAESVLSTAPYATKKCILTGTPMPHGYPDLYNMFDVLWNETTPIDNTNRIRIDYLMKTNNPEEAKNMIDEAIGPLFYRVRKSELGLGPQIFHPPIMIEMKEKERYLYDSIAESIRQFSREDYLLEADTLGNLCRARIMRLRQTASYPKLLDTAIPNYNENLWQTDSEIANTIYNYDDLEKPAKLDKLIELVKDFKEQNLKVVIWTNFIRVLKLIFYELAAHGIYSKYIYGGVPLIVDDSMDETEDRETIRKEFVDPNSGLDVLLANPAACSEAISLHKTCQNAIYYDLSFNCAQYLQSLDRIHRVGGSEDKKVEYYFLHYNNSIDQQIMDNLEIKKERMYALIEKDYPIYSLDMFEDDDTEINVYKKIIGLN
tara:strand:+ start:1330 stop:3228 length:1899 start_codon:yes stop_codon:yes gene_type:complete